MLPTLFLSAIAALPVQRMPPPVCLANAVTNGLVNSKFCLNVKLCIKSERRAEFIDCIRNNQKGTLSTEPLAIEYVWGEDTEVANTFHFYEKYQGKQGFEAHQATPHFAAWEVRLSPVKSHRVAAYPFSGVRRYLRSQIRSRVHPLFPFMKSYERTTVSATIARLCTACAEVTSRSSTSSLLVSGVGGPLRVECYRMLEATAD